VLKWITERIEGKENAVTTPIGYVPKAGSIDTNGLDVSEGKKKKYFMLDLPAQKK